MEKIFEKIQSKKFDKNYP